MGPRFLLFHPQVVKELGVDFGFSWLVLGTGGVHARSVLPQASLLLNPAAVNAALVLAPRVVSSASMDVVVMRKGRWSHASWSSSVLSDFLPLLSLFFFVLNTLVVRKTCLGVWVRVPEVSRGNWGKGWMARTEGCLQLLRCYFYFRRITSFQAIRSW